MSEANKRYKSKYEAYPFLSDQSDDLRCDFEIATDGFASETGLLSAILRKLGGPERAALAAELDKTAELVYHANPALRTFFSVKDEEIQWLMERATELYDLTGGRQESLFQVPCGSEEACRAHILRSKAKGLVRLAYCAQERGATVPEALYDFLNLLSGYFYRLALFLNKLADVAEIPYISRNYK
ncbi:MAG: ATP--cob(I)alamin adenosyltransferase [Oscillospiraceae bacterium]|nr:ATP--cob(I)alamin adenosyltransferase [Oscillospiraceae bacterium]